MTALRVLVDENLAQRAEVLGEKFRSAVRAINSPLVGSVRGMGLLNAVVIDQRKSTKGRTAWEFCLLLKSRGVLAKPTHVDTYVLTSLSFSFFLYASPSLEKFVLKRDVFSKSAICSSAGDFRRDAYEGREDY